MNREEAVKECKRWLAHLDKERERTKEMVELAALARAGQKSEAKRRMRRLDQKPLVFDCGELEKAVAVLVIPPPVKPQGE